MRTPGQAGTVPVRIQVLTHPPRSVDVVVPVYLPVDDLARRIVRDAGLRGAGAPRLRARGRVLAGHERLQDVGVVPHELVHLLLAPPSGARVQERSVPVVAEASVSRASRAARVAACAAWAGLWALAASQATRAGVAFWGGLGAGWLAAAVAHSGDAPDRAFLARLAAALGAIGAPALVFLALGPDAERTTTLGGLGCLVGGALGWLAWMGPLEPLRDDAGESGAAAGADEPPCGLCREPVQAHVRRCCPHGCDRAFHVGCLRAREAVAAGGGCVACGR